MTRHDDRAPPDAPAEVLALGDVLSDLSILLTRFLGENVKLQLVHGGDLWAIKADLKLILAAQGFLA